jgi:hypothetical protein
MEIRSLSRQLSNRAQRREHENKTVGTYMPNRLYRVTVHKCPGRDSAWIMANNLAKKSLMAKPIFGMSLGSSTF